MIRFLSFPLASLLLCAPAYAAEQQAAAPAPASACSLLQGVIGLSVVLGLMAGAALILKRMGVAGPCAGNVAKVVGVVSVCSR